MRLLNKQFKFHRIVPQKYLTKGQSLCHASNSHPVQFWKERVFSQLLFLCLTLSNEFEEINISYSISWNSLRMKKIFFLNNIKILLSFSVSVGCVSLRCVISVYLSMPVSVHLFLCHFISLYLRFNLSINSSVYTTLFYHVSIAIHIFTS